MLGPFHLEGTKDSGLLVKGETMSDVFKRAAEAAKDFLSILQLVGALQDAINDLRTKRKLGKPVRKRTLQLKANLAAVLAADKAQAEKDETDEVAFLQGDSAQQELDFDKDSG